MVSKNLKGARCLAPVRHGFTICQFLNPTSTITSLAASSTTAMAISLTDIEQLASINPMDHQTSEANVSSLQVTNEQCTKGTSQQHLIEVAEDLGVSHDNSDLNTNQRKILKHLLVLIEMSLQEVLKNFVYAIGMSLKLTLETMLQ